MRSRTLVLLVSLALLGGCGASAATTQGRSARPLLRVHGRAVDLLLLAGENSDNGGFNFDGAGNGAMTITVARSSRVTITCTNYSTILSHSCAVVDPGGASLAFTGSSIPHPHRGLQPGRSARFSFTANRLGRYQIVCLVAGHRGQGMWDWFDVVQSGSPSIRGAKDRASIA